MGSAEGPGRGAAPSGPRGLAPRRLPCERSARESGAQGYPERQRRRRRLLARARAACQGRRVPAEPASPLLKPPPARPPPARGWRPPSRRRRARPRSLPFLRAPAPPGAPTLRGHLTPPNLAVFKERRKLGESKGEQTAKCRPNAHSRYSPILHPCYPAPAPLILCPTSALASQLPITLLFYIHARSGHPCGSRPSSCHQPTPPPFVNPTSPASSVFFSPPPRPPLLSLFQALHRLPGSTHAYLRISLAHRLLPTPPFLPPSRLSFPPHSFLRPLLENLPRLGTPLTL